MLTAFGDRMLLYIPRLAFDLPLCRFVDLDLRSGKVSVGGDGNKRISFTSRPDIARYLSYVLTHLPAEKLSNRSFKIAGDTKAGGYKQYFPNSA